MNSKFFLGALSSLMVAKRGLGWFGSIASSVTSPAPRLATGDKSDQMMADKNGYREPEATGRGMKDKSQSIEEEDLQGFSESRDVYPESRLPLAFRQAVGFGLLITAAVVAKVGIIDRMGEDGAQDTKAKQTTSSKAKKAGGSNGYTASVGGDKDAACEMETCNPKVSPTSGSVNQRSSLIDRSKVYAVVKKWQVRKAAALGKDHDVGLLSYSLAEPMLGDWKDRAIEAEEK